MQRSFFIIIFCAVSILSIAHSQTSSSVQNQQDKNKPATTTTQQPGVANPFPEDTTIVPVMSNRTAAAAAGDDSASDSDASAANISLPSNDSDPIRSPESVQQAETTQSGTDSWSSSSSSAIDKILPKDDDEDQPQDRRKGRMSKPEPVHVETAKENIDVGKYYMESKNWSAALSRFESALVLAPEEPDVYWGLAESERNLGNYAKAKAHYEKVVEYDPDSKHGKAAAKTLKTPEIANVK